jgi:hypothetical protein
MTDTITLSNTKLKAQLGFSPDDLAANRAGHLSAAQKARLRHDRQRLALINAGIICAAILLATLAIFFGLRGRSAILLVIGIGVTLCNAALVGILTRAVLRLTFDLNSEQVETLRGSAAHTVRIIARRTAVYLVHIGDVRLAVDQALFDSFATGVRYQVYRAPRSATLLAAEALD